MMVPALIESSAVVQLPKGDGPQLLPPHTATSVQAANWIMVKNCSGRRGDHSYSWIGCQAGQRVWLFVLMQGAERLEKCRVTVVSLPWPGRLMAPHPGLVQATDAVKNQLL